MAIPATRIKGTSQKAATEKTAMIRAERSQDSRSVTRHNGHSAPNQNAMMSRWVNSSGANSPRRGFTEVCPIKVNETATSAAPVTPTIVKPRAESRFITNATGEPTEEEKKRLAVVFAETGCIPTVRGSRTTSLTVNGP